VRGADAQAIAESLRRPPAFEAVFTRHFAAVHRYAQQRVGVDAAEEIASETFLQAFDNRRRFDPSQPSARPWLLGIATNLMRRRWRDEKRQLAAYARTLEGVAAGSAAASDAATPNVPWVDHDLAAALMALAGDDRDALLLHVWADLSYQEIGDALAVPSAPCAHGSPVPAGACASGSRPSAKHRRQAASAGRSKPSTSHPPLPRSLTMDDLEFLKTHVPESESPGDEATARARAALLARIDADAAAGAASTPTRVADRRMPGRPRRRVWRWAGVAAACAAAVAIAGAFLLDGSPARPDTAAASALHQAAVVALKQPSPAPLAAGEYAYTKSEGVFLTSTAAKGQATMSTRTPFVRETWMGARSRLRETYGKAEFVSAQDRANWIAAGKPDFFGDPGTSIDPLGKYVPLDLPTDAGALFTELKTNAAGHGTSLYNEMFVLVGDDLRGTATSPAQRAALYDVAARIPGVELVGNVTDSTGRPGVAVAMTDETTHIRQVLILDPTTSQLLAEEQRVVAGNEFGWPSGTLMGSQTYLVHAVAGSNSEVPPAQQ